MFLALFSHLLSAWFAFALPSYATYKALARADDPLAVRTLAMYWAVLALFAAFEQSLGLVLSWLPFYWELRTIFLLYIALPQTRGSTYVYESLLHPWLSRNEADIDVAVASAQSNLIAFGRARIAALFDLVSALLNNASQSGLHKPGEPPADAIGRLWADYAPPLVAAVAPKVPSDPHVRSTASSAN